MPSPTPLPNTSKLTAKELRQLMENNNKQGTAAPAAANPSGGQTNTTSGTQATPASPPASGVTANPQPAPTPAAPQQQPSAGAQQAKELLTLNRPGSDAFGTQPEAGAQPGAAPTGKTAPVAPTAKPADGVSADGKAPSVRPADGSSATNKPPVNTLPAPGSSTGASSVNGKETSTNNTTSSPANEITQKLLGGGSDTTASGTKTSTGKTVTRTVIGPNGQPMTITERKRETPGSITSAIPSTYSYYARSEAPRATATRSSSSGNSDSSGNASGNKVDTENKESKDSPVAITNEESLKIQGELGSSDLTSASVLNYTNNLQEQLVQLQREGTGALSKDDFESAQGELKDKLSLAESLYTRIKGTQLRILQNDPGNETQTPVSLAGPALFGGAEATGLVG